MSSSIHHRHSYESCHTYEWVMSHRQVHTCSPTSRLTLVCVMSWKRLYSAIYQSHASSSHTRMRHLASHTRTRHPTIVIAEYRLFQRVFLQKTLIILSIIVTLTSRVTLTNESYRTDKCAVDHTTIITHSNASCDSHVISSHNRLRRAFVITL